MLKRIRETPADPTSKPTNRPANNSTAPAKDQNSSNTSSSSSSGAQSLTSTSATLSTSSVTLHILPQAPRARRLTINNQFLSPTLLLVITRVELQQLQPLKKPTQKSCSRTRLQKQSVYLSSKTTVTSPSSEKQSTGFNNVYIITTAASPSTVKPAASRPVRSPSPSPPLPLVPSSVSSTNSPSSLDVPAYQHQRPQPSSAASASAAAAFKRRRLCLQLLQPYRRAQLLHTHLLRILKLLNLIHHQ